MEKTKEDKGKGAQSQDHFRPHCRERVLIVDDSRVFVFRDALRVAKEA